MSGTTYATEAPLKALGQGGRLEMHAQGWGWRRGVQRVLCTRQRACGGAGASVWLVSGVQSGVGWEEGEEGLVGSAEAGPPGALWSSQQGQLYSMLCSRSLAEAGLREHGTGSSDSCGEPWGV